MRAQWLIVLVWSSLGVAFMNAGWILVDICVRGYRLKMVVMEAARPVTALYFGPIAGWAYRRFGRQTSQRWLDVGDYLMAVLLGLALDTSPSSRCATGVSATAS